jgi:hypothetical protein
LLLKKYRTNELAIEFSEGGTVVLYALRVGAGLLLLAKGTAHRAYVLRVPATSTAALSSTSTSLNFFDFLLVRNLINTDPITNHQSSVTTLLL